jgi:hypothetical protein
MVKTASIFSQLQRFIPQSEFGQFVKKHEGEKHAKGFTCWSQLVAMLYCQLAGAESLREICLGLASTEGKMRHLGLRDAPNKSTLSYANAHRPAAIFQDLFWCVLDRFRNEKAFGSKKHPFRFKNPLYSMDSTTISLCLSLFPWAKYKQHKGGVKAHVILSNEDYLPVWMLLTEAKTADVKAVPRGLLNPGSIVAMDRAYNDYGLFAEWTEGGVFFVTRKKSNAVYEVVEEIEVPQNRNIRKDQLIRLTGTAGEKCPHLLRLVVVLDEKNDQELELLTNHLDFGATTIADIYKERWQIELFFKALKQNLKVKTFVGTTPNALLVQIWTALLALLLLRWCHHQSKSGWHFSLIAALLRLNLFVYRGLRDWLDNPVPLVAEPPPISQLSLCIPGIGQL